MEITVTGLNHRRAPVELREKLAVADAALPLALAELQRALAAQEMVILSTCNRVEIYTVHDAAAPPAETVTAALSARHGVPAPTLAPALYRHQGAEAVRHLFRVAASLDSMVLGEAQILGQVKDAYLAAQEAGATGRVFNRLFQQALHAAKRVRSSTSIGEKNVSIPSVAARLAEKIFQELAARRLLIIGAGETGELTLAAFRNRGVTDFLVANRTVERARALAERFGGAAHGLDELPSVLSRADIVIACIAAEGYILSPPDLRQALQLRRQEPIFLIDLAVPRNINPEVNEIDNVYLYNVDNLEAIAQQNLLEREREVERSAPLIEEETRTFFREVTPPDITALLVAFRQKLQSIGDEETRRTLSRLEGLPVTARDEVVELARRIINKVLHTPSEHLRGGALDGQSHTIIELVRKLFDIKG